MPAEELTACGMAMGFGYAAANVDRMDMPRQRAEDFVRLAGFDEPVAAGMEA